MMPTKAVLLYDQTGAANSPIDTGFIDTADFDQISFFLLASGGTFAAVGNTMLGSFDGGSTYPISRGAALTAGQTVACGAWGPGTDATATAAGGAVTSQPLPPGMKMTVAALGVGVSGRLIIYGRRRHRGPDVTVVNPD